MNKPTYVQNRGRTFRFPSIEESIRNSSDGHLALMIYANGTLESSSPQEIEIAEDEVLRRKVAGVRHEDYQRRSTQAR